MKSLLLLPLVFVSDPAVLDGLVARGLSLPRLLTEGKLADGSNRELHATSPLYRSLVEHLETELQRLKREDPRLDVSMAKAHRLFDARWLRSGAARWELAGVVNRLDRQPFFPGKCGEIRLVYRLVYETQTKGVRIHSRLPFTINFVSWAGEASECRAVARLWNQPPSALAEWLPGRVGGKRLKSVEVNLQSVRWPSTTRGDLGGHAEYLLRVFEREGDRLVPAPLENTPDVARLAKDAKSRSRLLAWIRGNLDAIDDGVAVVPAEFLAREATSVSPRGMARLANRPFARLFTARDFADLKFEGRRFVRSPKALLRRLDDMSCTGCHQARAVAGFHLLGVDRPATSPVNAVAVAGSPHLLGDLERRRGYTRALLDGKPTEPARPFSDEGEGAYGAHCGLGDPGFRHWTCRPGLRCRALGLPRGDDTVGQCFPEAEGGVGDSCEVGVMRPDAHPHHDRVVGARPGPCGTGVCERNVVGFPDGMCALPCGQLPAEGTCGQIAILAGFNACLSQGRPFPRCLEENVRPGGLRACGEDAPCRDDYLCARAPRGSACIPPYFLFQMRVDGHPVPPPG